MTPPMTTTDSLEALEKIAIAAIEDAPGIWRQIPRSRGPHGTIPSEVVAGDGIYVASGDTDAIELHIAAFGPLAVLALIAQARALPREIEALKKQRDFECDRANRLAAFIREAGVGARYHEWEAALPPAGEVGINTGAPSSDASAGGWRPQVRAFADLMEAQLRANDHKGGWENEDPLDLMDRLYEEAQELFDELPAATATTDWSARVGREAADVSNFAMMIADVCGALPKGVE